MTERGLARAESLPGAADRRAGPRRARLAVVAGSTTALVTASLAGSALGFLNKSACRAGDWNLYLKQFQAHCYTDIYPLYFGEGLSSGKVPYTGHPVEYPGLIGAAMQAAGCRPWPGRCGRLLTLTSGAGSSSTSPSCC